MSEATRGGITKVHMTDQDGVSLAGGTGGGPASIADGLDIAEGSTSDAVWSGSGAGTVVSILKKIATSGAAAGLTDAQLRATPVPVSGTFWQATQPISAASLPLPTNAATESTLALLQVAGGTAIGSLKSQLASAVAATSAPSYTDGTINPLSQTLAGALRVGGTVTATGPLTDTQLRASAVPVSGSFFQATQPVSIAAAVAVTGTFWQATQPVSLTSTTITGSVAVTGTFWQATQPVSLAAAVDVSDRAARLLGAVNNANLEVPFTTTTVQAVGTTDAAAYSFVSVQITSQGTSSTITFQGSNDNVNWNPIAMIRADGSGGTAQTTTLSTTLVSVLQHRYFRLNVTGISAGTTAGTIEFSSIARTPAITRAVLTDGTTAAKVAAASTAAVAADPAIVVALSPNNNILANALFTKATDGTNTAAVKAASTAAAAADPALVVSLSPNSPATTELSTGMTTFCNTALSSTKTAVKASAGKVFGWMIHNPSAATVYIQVWNVAIASITVGTTAPTWVIPLPAGASANVFNDKGVTHSTEINVAATTTATGSTAPATPAVVSIFYV